MILCKMGQHLQHRHFINIMQSQYNQRSFLPNSRNSGGRAQINQLRKNHIIALVNSQPAIDTRKPPKPHVDHYVAYSSKNKGPKGFLADEVQETYKRVKAVKHGYSDNKEPLVKKTFGPVGNCGESKLSFVTPLRAIKTMSIPQQIVSKSEEHDGEIQTLQEARRHQDFKKVELPRMGFEIEPSLRSRVEVIARMNYSRRSVRPKSAKSKKSTQGHTNTLTNMLSMDTSEIINFSKFSHIAPSYYISEEPLQKTNDQFALDYIVSNYFSNFKQEANQKKGSQNKEYQNHSQQLKQVNVPLVISQEENSYEAHLIDQYDQESMENRNNNQNQNYNQNQDQNQNLNQKKEDVLIRDQLLTETAQELDGYELYDKNRKQYRNIKIPLIPPTDNQRTIKKQIMLTIMDYKVSGGCSIGQIFQKDMIYQIGNSYVQKNQWMNQDLIMNICTDIAKNLYGCT